MTSGSLTNKLAIINDSEIWSSHSLNVLIVFICNENHSSVPWLFFKEGMNVLFGLGTFLKTNNGSIVISRRSFRAQTSGWWVFKYEFLDTLSDRIKRKLSLWDFISWCKENNSSILLNLMLCPKAFPYSFDCLFKVICEVLLVNEEWFVLKKTAKFFRLRIDVSDSLVDSILSYIVSWEAEAIWWRTLKWKGMVYKVKVLLSPLLVVLDEFVMEMSLWLLVCSVLVKL